MSVHPRRKFGDLIKDLGQGFSITLFQGLDAGSEALGDALDLRLNVGLDGSEPFVFDNELLDLILT